MPEEELKAKEAEVAKAGELQSHLQQPGQCMLIPDGHWHCTYNQGEALTLGVGGIGRLRSEPEAFCAFGDVAKLREVPLHLLEKESAQLFCTAAEQELAAT